jgi:hypothetical protein
VPRNTASIPVAAQLPPDTGVDFVAQKCSYAAYIPGFPKFSVVAFGNGSPCTVRIPYFLQG